MVSHAVMLARVRALDDSPAGGRPSQTGLDGESGGVGPRLSRQSQSSSGRLSMPRVSRAGTGEVTAGMRAAARGPTVGAFTRQLLSST
jgi:hypothetical protein